MSFADMINKEKNKRIDASGAKKRYRHDQSFLPGVGFDTYLAVAAPAALDGAKFDLKNKTGPEVRALSKTLPAMRKAFNARDIFAYNRAKERFDFIKGGRKPAIEAPDPLMLKKDARRTQSRKPRTGRASTMLSLGPTY